MSSVCWLTLQEVHKHTHTHIVKVKQESSPSQTETSTVWLLTSWLSVFPAWGQFPPRSLIGWTWSEFNQRGREGDAGHTDVNCTEFTPESGPESVPFWIQTLRGPGPELLKPELVMKSDWSIHATDLKVKVHITHSTEMILTISQLVQVLLWSVFEVHGALNQNHTINRTRSSDWAQTQLLHQPPWTCWSKPAGPRLSVQALPVWGTEPDL